MMRPEFNSFQGHENFRINYTHFMEIAHRETRSIFLRAILRRARLVFGSTPITANALAVCSLQRRVNASEVFRDKESSFGMGTRQARRKQSHERSESVQLFALGSDFSALRKDLDERVNSIRCQCIHSVI